MAQRWWVENEDCLKALKRLPAQSVDAVVSDPPYGISFGGSKWDYDIPVTEIWSECRRVLKPGGYCVAFASTRTQHRMACRIEDGGLEIVDLLAWIYPNGWVKSLSVDLMIDKKFGVERTVIGEKVAVDLKIAKKGICRQFLGMDTSPKKMISITQATHPVAKRFDGWKTALRPAMEPITLAQKPREGTVVDNCLRYGTGALNVGATGIDRGDEVNPKTPWDTKRYPANVLLGVPERLFRPLSEAAAQRLGERDCLPEAEWQSLSEAEQSQWEVIPDEDRAEMALWMGGEERLRFFFSMKATQKDRNEGMEDSKKADGSALENVHPTVKPTELMRYLCRLVTPKGGLILDPFCGSGSTGKAALLEGFSFLGIERRPKFTKISQERIRSVATTCEAVEKNFF